MESAALAFGYARDPSLTSRQRTLVLWKDLVQQEPPRVVDLGMID